MATYDTEIEIPCPVDRAFSFVSDFANAALWDPRTYAAERVTGGQIGVGTRFVLTGGALRGSTLRRLRLSPTRVGMKLPYDVVEFDPPSRFVLEGRTAIYRYDDRLTFTAVGEHTHLRYQATLDLRGPLRIAEPLLALLFRRIGDDATRDLGAVVMAGTSDRSAEDR